MTIYFYLFFFFFLLILRRELYKTRIVCVSIVLSVYLCIIYNISTHFYCLYYAPKPNRLWNPISDWLIADVYYQIIIDNIIGPRMPVIDQNYMYIPAGWDGGIEIWIFWICFIMKSEILKIRSIWRDTYTYYNYMVCG